MLIVKRIAGRSQRDRRRGTVAAVVGVTLPLVIAVTAIALDGGTLYSGYQMTQSAADAAALAAANSLYSYYSTNSGLDPQGVAAKSATTTAQNNLPAATVTVNIPPKSGTFKGLSGYAEVIVANTQPRYFSALWGPGTLSVSGRSVARGSPVAYSKAAILVLDPTGSSVTLSGTPSVTAVNGSIVVDSTSSSSIQSSGIASITAPELDLSGGIQYSGHNPNNATVTKTGQTPTPDPLGPKGANLPAPSTSSLTTQSSSTLSLSGQSSQTLNPGVYNGGISLSGQASLTLNPGIYYINGGGINMSGGSGISGNGVMIYNTGGGGINLTGTGSISLHPMTSGTYAGLTIFQDPSNTASAAMSGGSSISNTGTFYFPNATVALTGNSGVGVVGAQFIAKDLTFAGTSGIEVKYDNSVASKAGIAIVE